MRNEFVVMIDVAHRYKLGRESVRMDAALNHVSVACADDAVAMET